MTLARLQLAVGAAATLIEELPPDGPRRLFAARAPHESPDAAPSRLVVWHPAPPDGPTPGALLDRMAALRAVAHPNVAAILATGVSEGRAWVVEPAPGETSLAERLAAERSLPMHEMVRLFREVTRALAALHRRGLHHGSLDAAALVSGADGVRLHRLGRSVGGSVAADLHALGIVMRAAIGQSGGASRAPRRSDVHQPVAAVLTALADPDPSRRPGSADAVLAALDAIPDGGSSRGEALFEGSRRGARPPGQLRAAMYLAIAAVLLLLVWLLARG